MATLFSLLALLAAFSVVTPIVSAASATSGYVLESSTKFNRSIPVYKYATRTGIKIVIAKTNGPLVNGYLCVATKDHTDNGIPHSLEHLVFMGSEDYPYKGALDLIANRCNAFGTNAFTAIDRTCYTTSHIGKDGFLFLLPVYMDHILYPTLTPSAFLTEVYHVTGEGNDGGVVYSEQAPKIFDNNWRSLLDITHEMSGYAAAVGGILKNLRENATHQMNVVYHKKFYRPDNLCITICGDVNIDEVMKSIQKMEEKIFSKPQLPQWTRPWKERVPALETAVVKTVIPSSNEGSAQIYLAWRAPDPGTEFRKLMALNLLIPYLYYTATATDFYSSYVSGGVNDFTIYFEFGGVPLQNVNSVYPTFQRRMRNIVNKKESLNMDTIKTIIDNAMRGFSSTLESAPHDAISGAVGDDFIYGETSAHFEARLNTQEQLVYLAKASDSYWIDLIREYLYNTKYALSIGIPSQAELDRINKENDELIPKRIKKLGPRGLKKKGDELEKAIKMNNRPFPDSIVTSVPLPRVDNINYHDVKIYRAGDRKTAKPVGLDLDSWPVYAEAYDCRTKYVYVTATIFTHTIEATLRPYLYLLLKLINDLPINHDDEMNALNDFKTMSGDYRIGLSNPLKSFSSGSFSQTAALTMQAKSCQYEQGIKYFLAKLQYVTFEASDIKNAASALLNNDIPESLTNQYAAQDLLKTMYYKPESNIKVHSMLYQKKFLTSLITFLDDETKAQQIVADFTRLRETLFSSSNLAVHVTADFTLLSQLGVDLNRPWKQFNFGSGPKKLNLVRNTEVMLKANDIVGQGEIVGLEQETAYLVHNSPGLTDFNHNDVPALTVALAYCTQIEGPLWRRVRGPGYAYNFGLFLDAGDGVIQLSLYRASDVINGFKETINVINERSQPDAVWDRTLFESAKGAATFSAVNRAAKLGDVQLQSILLSFRNVPDSYNKDLVSKIAAVTIDDVKRVAQKYMTKIFSPTQSKTAIVCNAKEGQHVADAVKQLGFDLPYRSSWDDSLLSPPMTSNDILSILGL